MSTEQSDPIIAHANTTVLFNTSAAGGEQLRIALALLAGVRQLERFCMSFKSLLGLVKASNGPADVPKRFARAISARSELGEDFFGGWLPEDEKGFSRFAMQGEAVPGKIVDFLGIKTTSSFHPWAKHLDGIAMHDLPIPDDGLRAEAIEYFATFDALDRAPTTSFAMAELGASYGPWACVSAVLARRTGRTDIHVTAVEASDYLFKLIPDHLAENGVANDWCDIRLVKGAIAPAKGVLYFPRVSNASENGGQVVSEAKETDYVGRHVEHEEVQAFVMSDIVDRPMDLLHIDIQGLEHDVLAGSIELLNQRVRAIFVGTHSRKIEGLLIDLFHANGWRLERERPAKFVYEPTRPDVVGWTTRDGGQYWINPRL